MHLKPPSDMVSEMCVFGHRIHRTRLDGPPKTYAGFTKKHNIRSYAQNLQIPVGVVLDELSKLFNVFSYIIL